MTEGLSDRRFKSIMHSKDEYPLNRVALFCDAMLEILDEPFSDDETIAGGIHTERVTRMCGMIKKTWEYGIMEGEDRAAKRLTELLRGITNV